MAKSKKCTLCGKRKAVSKFYKDATHNDGLQSRCKECQAELRRKK